jgi:C-terminal processing protease CtpA/Prc
VYLQSDLKWRERAAVSNGADREDALSEEEKQALLQPTQKNWTCSVLPFLRLGVRVLDTPGGLRLEEIYPGTPAGAAEGLKPGDIIVGVGEKPVRDERGFLLAVDATPGDRPIVLRLKGPGADQPRAVAIKLRDNDVPADVRIPPAPAVAPAPPARRPGP